MLKTIISMLIILISASNTQNISNDVFLKYKGKWIGLKTNYKFEIEIFTDTISIKVNNEKKQKYNLFEKDGKIWFQFWNGKIELILNSEKSLQLRYYSFKENPPIIVPSITMVLYKKQ